jgi:hypothetical protein
LNRPFQRIHHGGHTAVEFRYSLRRLQRAAQGMATPFRVDLVGKGLEQRGLPRLAGGVDDEILLPFDQIARLGRRSTAGSI